MAVIYYIMGFLSASAAAALIALLLRCGRKKRHEPDGYDEFLKY